MQHKWMSAHNFPIQVASPSLDSDQVLDQSHDKCSTMPHVGRLWAKSGQSEDDHEEFELTKAKASSQEKMRASICVETDSNATAEHNHIMAHLCMYVC